MNFVVTPEIMQAAENLAFEKGLEPYIAMEKAGTFVFYEAEKYNKILVVANSGNNGGDGFVAAMKLKSIGKKVDVLFIGKTEKLSVHARKFYDEIKDNIIENPENDYDCVIDAIFGIGFRGEVEGEFLKAVNLINSFKNKAKIISIDIPSGLNGLTGEAENAVIADTTVTFQAEKIGLIINKGADFAGEIKVCNIGIDISSDLKRIDKVDFPKIKNTAHKGTQGHIGVIAGALGMEGAAMLASAAAIKSGAGKVSLAVSEDMIKEAKRTIIITPHMGEASRLFNVEIQDLIKNPFETTKEFVKDTGITVLLKSNYNLIVSENEGYISSFGCPGMATAGSGDVLAGIVASMVHIMPSFTEAAINTSYLHGKAGFLAQKEKTPYGVTASDILHNIFKGTE